MATVTLTRAQRWRLIDRNQRWQVMNDGKLAGTIDNNQDIDLQASPFV